jgi:hypothetical protein
MISLDSLATEVLLNIVQYVDSPEDFTSIERSETPPGLKSLSLTCRRLYAVCFPFLFRSVRLHLRKGRARQSIEDLRGFIRGNGLLGKVESVGLRFESEWNTGKIGLELKMLIRELAVKSLSLHQQRGHEAVREKSARWPNTLDTVERVRLQTVDMDDELKMLFLRQCPARELHVDDGSFRTLYDNDHGYYYRHPLERPGVSFLKPSTFPNVSRVVYYAAWPPYNRFTFFLDFVSALAAIEHLTVTLMGGEDRNLELKKKGYKPSIDAIRYREMITAYQILAHRVDNTPSLKHLIIGDHRLPWRGDTDPPETFVERSPGVYEKNDRPKHEGGGLEIAGPGAME